MFIAIPTNCTEIDKRAFRDSAEHCNASDVFMVYQGCCAAIGMGLLFEKKNFVLIDFGFGKTEITVFANSLPISIGTVRMGTNKIYRLIKNLLMRKYRVSVSEEEVDLIFEALENQKGIQIQNTVISSDEVESILGSFFELVNDEFAQAIEQVSTNPQTHIAIKNGIFLTGGGSLNAYLRNKLFADFALGRVVSKNPLLDCINGLNTIMNNPERFKGYILT